jgi:hypothetical protein
MIPVLPGCGKQSAPFSIHQISLMGESVEKKPVGTWFGPNTVAQVSQQRKLGLNSIDSS